MPTTWFSRQQPICFVNIPVSFRDCQKAGAVIKEKKITVGDGWMGLVHAACGEGTEKNAEKKK